MLGAATAVAPPGGMYGTPPGPMPAMMAAPLVARLGTMGRRGMVGEPEPPTSEDGGGMGVDTKPAKPPPVSEAKPGRAGEVTALGAATPLPLGCGGVNSGELKKLLAGEADAATGAGAATPPKEATGPPRAAAAAAAGLPAAGGGPENTGTRTLGGPPGRTLMGLASGLAASAAATGGERKEGRITDGVLDSVGVTDLEAKLEAAMAEDAAVRTGDTLRGALGLTALELGLANWEAGDTPGRDTRPGWEVLTGWVAGSGCELASGVGPPSAARVACTPRPTAATAASEEPAAMPATPEAGETTGTMGETTGATGATGATAPGSSAATSGTEVATCSAPEKGALGRALVGGSTAGALVGAAWALASSAAVGSAGCDS